MTAPSVLPADTPASDPDVARGVSLVEEGEYDAGLFTLDAAARRLVGHPEQARDLAQAYLYLGVAYLAKGHEASARAQFREALKEAKDLKLSPDKFAPKVIEIFDQARETANEESAQAARPGPAAGPSESKPARGGSKKGLLILGGVLAAGAGVAAAAAGGGSSSSVPPVTQPQDSRQVLADTNNLPAKESQRYFLRISAPGTLDATVTWTDPQASFHLFYGCCGPRSNPSGQFTEKLSVQVTPGPAEVLVLNNVTFAATYTVTIRYP